MQAGSLSTVFEAFGGSSGFLYLPPVNLLQRDSRRNIWYLLSFGIDFFCCLDRYPETGIVSWFTMGDWCVAST